MASFLSDLFESIFVAGAPPALMLATNASFALLQLTLLLLVLYTWSIHFILLSLICGGLWGLINWFVAELNKVREVEAKAGRLREIARERGELDEGYEGGGEGEGEGEEGEAGGGGGGGGGGFDERDYRNVLFEKEGGGTDNAGVGGGDGGGSIASSSIIGIPGEWGKGDDGGLGVDIQQAREMQQQEERRSTTSGGGISMDERQSSRASAAHAVTDDEGGAEDMLRVEHGSKNYGPDFGVHDGTVRDRGRGKARVSAVESMSTEGETTEEEEGYEKIGFDEAMGGGGGGGGEGGGKKRR